MCYLFVMERKLSLIEKVIAAREPARAEREARARAFAERALAALDREGIRAWLCGSLAEGRFALHSDVDFVIDADPETFRAAIRVIEGAGADIDFDVLDWRRMRPEWQSLLKQ